MTGNLHMTLTANSPETVRLRRAVEVLNDTEADLIAELQDAMSTDMRRATQLVDAVAAARREFEAAWDAFETVRHAF